MTCLDNWCGGEGVVVARISGSLAISGPRAPLTWLLKEGGSVFS